MGITAHNANIWVNCSGAMSLQSQFPKPTAPGEEISESAKEGLAFHEITARILRSWSDPENSESFDRSDIVGQLSSHGLPFDDEMYDHAREYVNDVFGVYNLAGESREIYVESRISLDCIQQGAWSICDTYVVNPSKRTITIWDAKYGYSTVEVFENWQLLCYAVGLMDSIPNVERGNWTLELRVFQPRSFHRDGPSRSWVVTSEELRSYHNILVNAAEHSLLSDSCNSGPWCYNASCRRTCQVFQRHVYSDVDNVGESVGNELTGINLSVEIIQLRRAQERLKARLKALEESAIIYTRNGESLPGLMSEQTTGRKRWRADIDQNEVISMGDLMGIDLRKPRELDTPAQCLKKGVDESVINEYSETPKTGWRLVEATTDRIKMMFNQRGK